MSRQGNQQSKSSAVEYRMKKYEVPTDEEGYTQSFAVEDADGIQQFFNQFGFVVVRSVLTQEDCDNTLSGIYSLLEGASTFKRADVSTWNSWPADSIQQYGSPHKPPVFIPQFLRNRQNPNVHRVFAQLLNDNDLISNHDRCCFFRPTKGVQMGGSMQDMPQWGTKGNLHIDMNPWEWLGDGFIGRQNLAKLKYERLNDFIFENNQPSHNDGVQLQGVLNLADNREEDGGFACVPGFNHHFDEYFNAKKPSLNVPSHNFLSKDHVYKMGIRIPMRAGSMVVWDQRMAHGSFPNNSSRFRSAQFIKLFPARTMSAERAKAREQAVRQQLQLHGFMDEVTPLGAKLFGLS